VNVEVGPSFPQGYRPGIAIVGAGDVVAKGHLPAYAKYGYHVVGLYARRAERALELQQRFSLPRVYVTLDELLSDPAVDIVDLATPPGVRVELIRRALRAGKHVLAQKPLAPDLREAASVADEAVREGLVLAVNQNARWAPAWRAATLLITQGAVGDVFAVTHLFDKAFDFVLSTPNVDAIPHFLIYDYAVHWIDISRCWLDGKEPTTVRAVEHRTPNEPAAARSAWAGTIDVLYADGSSFAVRSVGRSATATPSCPFWIHGADGTIRGSILHGSDFVELERDGERLALPLTGEWWPDGFAGSMGELVTAIAEGREPYHSAHHNLLSLELTLAACRSAEAGGAPVDLAASARSTYPVARRGRP
jgi:predicted dehydrogenase